MYAERIQKLRDALRAKGAAAVLLSSFENRFYYSGFSGSAGALLVTMQKSYLFVDSRFASLAADEARECETVLIVPSLYRAINERLGAEHINALMFEDKEFTLYQYNAFKKNISAPKLIECSDMLSRLRSVKDDGELEIMQKGAHLCDEAFSYILSRIHAGATEKELALDLEVFLRRNGAQRVLEDTKILSGVRSALPHLEPSDASLEVGDAVLVDMTVRYSNYCVKLARTVMLKNAGDRERELYNIVLYSQLKGVNALRSSQLLAEATAQMKSNVESFGYGEYFFGGCNDAVGLSPSEHPSLRGGECMLLRGNVLCVAPALLVRDYGGIKIADTVAVGDDGGISLTTAPKEMLVI